METRARASRDSAIHLFLAQRHFCNETQKTVRLDRNTLDLSLLPGVHKAAVALRCMHVPDLSYSKGEAKRSTSEELIHDGDDDELKWRPKTRKIVRGQKQPGKICNKINFFQKNKIKKSNKYIFNCFGSALTLYAAAIFNGWHIFGIVSTCLSSCLRWNARLLIYHLAVHFHQTPGLMTWLRHDH